MRSHPWHYHVLSTLLICSALSCSVTPEILTPPEGLKAEKPEWLADADWETVMEGGIVTADYAFEGDDLRAYRGIFLVDLPTDVLWSFIRNPRVFSRMSSEIKKFELVSESDDGLVTVWEQIHKVIPMDLHFWLEYTVDDENQMIRSILADGHPNNIADAAGYHQLFPTNDPNVTLYVWSAYVVTGWWYVPIWLQHTIQSKKIMRMMDHYRSFYRERRREVLGTRPCAPSSH